VGALGYYQDDSGLQLLTHRYYDPNTGRFTTVNPIDYNGGYNLYAYVDGNPVDGVDPNELASIGEGNELFYIKL